MPTLADKLRKLDHDVQTDPMTFPAEPTCNEYSRAAEEAGLVVQQIVDSSKSTGCYYEVLAIYPEGIDDEPRGRFGREPAALVYSDYSRSTVCCWLVLFPWTEDEELPDA